MQWMLKCTKRCDACAELLFLLIKPTIYSLFFDSVLVSVMAT